MAVSFAVAAQGAFYGFQLRLLLGILGAALVGALTSANDARVLWHPLLTFGVGLSASAGLSAWAAGDAADALPTVALLVGMGIAVIVVRSASASEREVLVAAVVVVGAVSAFSGWAGVVFRREPLAQVHEGLWRAASTITYANATAGFLLLPALLALGWTARAEKRRLWALASYVLLVGIMATLSRGGILALGAGVGTLAVVSGSRRQVAAALWPVALGVATAVLGLLPSVPAGGPAAPGLAVSAFGVGAAVVVLSPYAGRRTLLLLVAVSIGSLSLGIQRFGAVGGEVTSGRLGRLSDERIGAWRAALRTSVQSPLLGRGPGNAVVEYRSKDGNLVASRYVHNEYLQTLVEQGVVGISVLLAGAAFAGRRVAGGRGAVSESTWTGGVAGLTALGLHSAGDFLWHVPVIPLTAAVVLGLLAGDGHAASGSFRLRSRLTLTKVSPTTEAS